MKRNTGRSRQAGFSLIELMLVIAILSLIIAAVFSQLGIAQQRLSTEETRLDDFQQARDFVDQFFRDINQIGTPNMQIMDTTQTFTPALTQQVSGCAAIPSTCTYSWANAYINDKRFAIGLIKIDSNEIRFEGSMSGNGTVQTVIYKINGSGTCSACMQRSQVDKATADPLTFSGTTTNQNWGTEVNDVILTNPVFKFYQYDGTLITIPAGGIDYTISQADADILASVKTIQINLTIRNNNVMDRQTGLPIETSFEGEISLNNCSMVATGYPMSCQ
jgi:prepilin-type N-terminal cleavage/methylation domain-containing protein